MYPTEAERRLLAAMAAHEFLAPSPIAVYERVIVLADVYRRRRRIARSAGGAVLGAGLLAGTFQMHGFLQGEPPPGPAVPPPPATFFAPDPAPAPAPAIASAPPGPASATPASARDRAVNAFLREGYDYEDAERLAALWDLPDPYEAKVKAGRLLQHGERVPGLRRG